MIINIVSDRMIGICEIVILKLTALFEPQKYKFFAFFPDW